MLNAKKKLLKELKAISKTMELTEQTNISMNYWVDETLFNNGRQYLPKCGYAACVLGDHVIRTNSKLDVSNIDDVKTLTNVASDYSFTLYELCKKVTGNSALVESIYSAKSSERIVNARLSRLFESAEINVLDHLHLNYPKPADAKIYIDACIEKLNKF